MTYRITLLESEEGWSVGRPALPGCHSQGATRKDAITNIREAIRLWLEVQADIEILLTVDARSAFVVHEVP